MSSRVGNCDNSDMHRCIDAAMEHLSSLWDQIGIHGDQRISRRDVVLLHLGNLLDEMVNEEQQLYGRLVMSVERLRANLAILHEELGLTPFQPPAGLALLLLEKELKIQHEVLNAEKQNRLCRLQIRSKIDQELCDALSMTPYYIPTGSVPNERQLAELDEHISALEVEKLKRRKMCISLRDDIVKILGELELSPNTSFEQEVVDANESISLTSDNIRMLHRYHDELERLKKENVGTVTALWVQVTLLWDRIKLTDAERCRFQNKNTGFSQRVIQTLKQEINRCEALQQQALEQQVLAARNELVSLWNKCYITPDERLAFKQFSETNMTEELLIDHQIELQKLADHFTKFQDLFGKLKRHQKLWAQYVEIERKVHDQDRFNNRGGNLLKEEQARNKIVVELPKIEQEIMTHICLWEEETGKKFLIEGRSFEERIRKLHEELSNEKENERILRRQQKARQMEEEIMYGSKPATPASKRFTGTPTKTPRKMPESPKAQFSQKVKVAAPCSPLTPSRRLYFNENQLPPNARIADAKRNIYSDFATKGDLMHQHPAKISAAAPFGSEIDVGSISMMSVGPYEEFAKGLKQQQSVGRPMTHQNVAYF